MNTQETINLPKRPDRLIDLKKEFNIQSNIQVKGFTSKTKWVPEIDHDIKVFRFKSEEENWADKAISKIFKYLKKKGVIKLDE